MDGFTNVDDLFHVFRIKKRKPFHAKAKICVWTNSIFAKNENQIKKQALVGSVGEKQVPCNVFT